MPLQIVFGAIPLARATAAILPRPIARASEAAQIRRPRSLNSGASARKRSPMSRSSTTTHRFHLQDTKSYKLFIYVS